MYQESGCVAEGEAEPVLTPASKGPEKGGKTGGGDDASRLVNVIIEDQWGVISSPDGGEGGSKNRTICEGSKKKPQRVISVTMGATPLTQARGLLEKSWNKALGPRANKLM